MSKAALVLFRLSALATLLAVAGGSIVCATRSGFDCHSWPGCYDDRFAPGAADIPALLVANPALEMVHRVIAMSTGGILILAALASLRLARPGLLVRVLPWVAVAAAGVSAIIGRASVLGLGVTAWAAAADLLAALTAMITTLLVALSHSRGGAGITFGPRTRPAAVAVILLVTMHVLALLAAGDRSFTRCLSWPILWLSHDDNFGLQIVRSGIALAAVIAVVLTVRVAWADPRHRGLGLVIGLVQAGILVLAVAYRASGADGGALGITFSVASVALVWLLTLFVGRTGMGGGRPGPSPTHPPVALEGLGRS